MILVGVDGSKTSARALQWAAEEARLRHQPLRLIYVFTPPTEEISYLHTTAPDNEIAAEARLSAQQVVDAMVDDAKAHLDGVDYETIVIGDAQPAKALAEVATAMDLLVVGSRGLGGFKGLMLGSVSQQCVQHAPCPVVVLRAREEDVG